MTDEEFLPQERGEPGEGFAPGARAYSNSGLYNGDLAALPPDPASVLTTDDTNALPFWAWEPGATGAVATHNGEGSGPLSGGAVTIAFPVGASGRAVFSQRVALTGSFAIAPAYTALAGFALIGTNLVAYLEVSYRDENDAVVGTLRSTSGDAETLRVIDDGPLPAGAQTVVVKVGAQTVGSLTSAASVTWQGAQFVPAVAEIALPNQQYSDHPVARIYVSGQDVIRVTSPGDGMTVDNLQVLTTTHTAAADPHPTYVPKALVDAKGDIIAATAADALARVPAGANGTVLTADSAAAAGVAWADHDARRAVRAHATVAQSIPHTGNHVVALNAERFDTHGAHHTSAAALTGTVAKTAGSNVLTGVGTSFTTELVVGQVISVPGGTTERKVVTEITSNTSLKVSGNFASTAAAQTATRVNSALVVLPGQEGLYLIGGALAFDFVNAVGNRQLLFQITLGAGGTQQVGVDRTDPNGISQDFLNGVTLWPMATWDFVEMIATQSSGGPLNTTVSSGNSPELWMTRLSA